MSELMGLQRADAAIVGAGLTGRLLGASLAHAGLRVSLIDAGDGDVPPCSAAATLLCPEAWDRIETAWGTEIARAHLLALQAQLQAMLASPPPYVQETPAFLYARSEEELPLLESRLALLKRLRLPVTVASDAGGCPFPVERSLMLRAQAVVDLHRWMTALQGMILRRGGRIFLHSRVIGMDSQRICTAKGCVDAPMIILCCGKPLDLHSWKLLALLESRMQLVCPMTGAYPLHAIQLAVASQGLKLCPSPGGMTVCRDGLRCGGTQQAEQPQLFERRLAALLPDWQSGTMHQYTSVESADGLPFIGTLPGSRHLFTAGYGAQGVLGSMHAAEVLSRRILGRTAPEDRLYAPNREIPPQIMKAARRRLTGLYWGNALRRSAPGCSHCGCRMRYLSAFQRWDCPYCGSATTMLGLPARGPAIRPARVSVRQRPDV